MADNKMFNYEETIIEGFICPSCLESFCRPELLESHYAEKHFHNTFQNYQPQLYLKGPIIGKIRSRTSEFEKLRLVQVNRTALETHILLIRLEKLYCIPEGLDSVERHSLEQSTVPWIEAKIDLCPRCGVPFGFCWFNRPITEDPISTSTPQSLVSSPLTSLSYRTRMHMRSASRYVTALIDNDPVYRRMHHCRLCGHIICSDCSFFLSKEDISTVIETCNFAARETWRDNAFSSEVLLTEEKNSKRKSSLLSRSASGTSFESVDRKRTQKAPGLRICEVCKSILQQKMQQIEESSTTPQGFEEFQVMKQEMAKVAEKLPLFSLMAGSLNSGEERYILESAKSLRLELLQSLQKIDEIGKKIASLDVFMVKSAKSQMRVNRTMGQLARCFVQNTLPSLRVLPNEKEHRQLAQQRTIQLSPKPREVAMQPEVGWMPSLMSGCTRFGTESTAAENDEVVDQMTAFDERDPRVVLLRQIDLVADYLTQARAANRSVEEIDNLAQNLAELESELMRLNTAS